jgi:hypothetical protein
MAARSSRPFGEAAAASGHQRWVERTILFISDWTSSSLYGRGWDMAGSVKGSGRDGGKGGLTGEEGR